MNTDFKNDIKNYLDQNDSDESNNFYKEYEVLIQGFPKVLKEFQILKEANLFSEEKKLELRCHVNQLSLLDFKLKRIGTKVFSQKYATQINELIDFAKSQMLLSQSQATLSDLENLLNADDKEVEKVKNTQTKEEKEDKDRLHEQTLVNLENQRQREKREHERVIRQMQEQFEEKRNEQDKIHQKQKSDLEKQRQELGVKISQLQSELSHFQDLQNTKISLENNERLKEFRKTAFIDSVVNDWIDAFNMDIKFRTKSTDFYDNLFSRQNLSLKDIVNIPTNYGTTINSTNENVLPLNFFVELEKLYLDRVNICFLPSLILPKLKTLIIQDCYKGCELTNARYGGIRYKFDLTDDWLKSFQRNNPKCHITITT